MLCAIYIYIKGSSNTLRCGLSLIDSRYGILISFKYVDNMVASIIMYTKHMKLRMHICHLFQRDVEVPVLA